ncbi:MAG: SRPBCC domain-containing protein, partial [Chloroflexota bacterium]|nr:SRPBCC domain-containing protein [Chloroflexota bacterium]
FDEVEPDTYESSMRVGIAAVRGTYQGRVEVSERIPDESFRLRIEGSGRPGGGTADARVRLEEAGDQTVMHYQAEVRARGTIARLGNRLMGGAARLLIGQFCKAIEQRIEQSAA